MKKGLLAMLFAVALVVPAVAENMWVGGSLGFQNVSPKDGDSMQSFSIAPEFGYSLNESWDIGADLEYISNDVEMVDGTDVTIGKENTFSIAAFARYHMFAIGDFNFIAKGSIFYEDTKNDDADFSYSTIGIRVVPVVSYSINETWSIDAVLNFAELTIASTSGDAESTAFGFNVNNGSLANIGFSYHF